MAEKCPFHDEFRDSVEKKIDSMENKLIEYQNQVSRYIDKHSETLEKQSECIEDLRLMLFVDYISKEDFFSHESASLGEIKNLKDQDKEININLERRNLDISKKLESNNEKILKAVQGETKRVEDTMWKIFAAYAGIVAIVLGILLRG